MICFLLNPKWQNKCHCYNNAENYPNTTNNDRRRNLATNNKSLAPSTDDHATTVSTTPPKPQSSIAIQCDLHPPQPTNCILVGNQTEVIEPQLDLLR